MSGTRNIIPAEFVHEGYWISWFATDGPVFVRQVARVVAGTVILFEDKNGGVASETFGPGRFVVRHQ